VEFVLLINKLDVPNNVADWRYYQDNKCMTFRQMRETHAGCALLRMRHVRREALLPICIALVSVIARFLYGSPLGPWAASTLLFIFINRFILIAAVASLLVAKLRLVIPRCSRLAACIQSLVIITHLHLIRGYAEAGRSFPQITREHYTRTRIRQRRAFKSPVVPNKIQVKVKRVPRLSRRSIKLQKKSASARVTGILKRLEEDAAKSRRKRLGLAPHDALPAEQDQNQVIERSWRNPVPDSHRVSLLTGWGQILSKVLTLAVIVTILTSMLSLPVAMGTGTTRSTVELASDNGFTNYAAAEVQARQREELA
jgi:hypothetical protein